MRRRLLVWIFSIFFLRKSIAKWNVGSLTLGAPSMVERIDAACLASVDKATSPRKPFVTIPCVQEPNGLSQTNVYIVHYCAISNLCSIVCIPEAFYSSGSSGKDMKSFIIVATTCTKKAQKRPPLWLRGFKQALGDVQSCFAS